jgi:AbrB family looped-hinge helix DNA binding protein
MAPYTARLDRSGRLVLPARIRAELELREGDEVVFVSGSSPGEVRLMSRGAAVRHSQALVRKHVPAGLDLAAELIRDRRQEAARERASGRSRTGR